MAAVRVSSMSGRCDYRVGDGHEVSERRLAPVAPAALDVVLAVAGGEGRVRQQHGVTAGHQQPRVPAPGPGVPGTQRAAVDPEQQRRRAGGGRAVREGQVRGHPGAVGRRRLHALERPLVLRALRRRGQADGSAAVEVDPHGFCGEFVGTAQGVGAAPVRRDQDVGVRGGVGRQPGHPAQPRRAPAATSMRKTGDAPSSSAVTSRADPSGSHAAGWAQRSQSWASGVNAPSRRRRRRRRGGAAGPAGPQPAWCRFR